MSSAESVVARPASTVMIAQLAKTCLESFQDCLQKASLIHPREVSLIEDQLGRFSLWSANIRVFSPRRSSLDHRLRDAVEVQDIVVGLLGALDYRLQACSRLLFPAAAIDAGALPPVNEGLQHAIQGVANEIGLLHKLSNTIRRASKATHNVTAVKEFEIKDNDGNNVEPFLLAVFDHYIH